MKTGHIVAVVVVALAACLLLVWAVGAFQMDKTILGVTPKSAKFALALIWAFGPPIWFYVEHKIWGGVGGEPGLEAGQQYARDFWLGAGALVLYLAAK